MYKATLIVAVLAALMLPSCATTELKKLKRENELLRAKAQLLEPGTYKISCEKNEKSVEFQVEKKGPHCMEVHQ